MKKPNLGDIFYFKNKIKIEYLHKDHIDEKHKHITRCDDPDNSFLKATKGGDIIVYEFIPGHKFKVTRVSIFDDFYITNLTTNDGMEFVSRKEIIQNLITHKKFRELRLKELLS